MCVAESLLVVGGPPENVGGVHGWVHSLVDPPMDEDEPAAAPSDEPSAIEAILGF